MRDIETIPNQSIPSKEPSKKPVPTPCTGPETPKPLSEVRVSGLGFKGLGSGVDVLLEGVFSDSPYRLPTWVPPVLPEEDIVGDGHPSVRAARSCIASGICCLTSLVALNPSN